MSDWIDLAPVSACPTGEAREFIAGGRVIALFHVDGHFYALDGVCPHQGGPLGKGSLTGCLVTCPWHGWQFNVVTGQHQTSASLVHMRHDVRVEDDRVWVRLAFSDLDPPPTAAAPESDPPPAGPASQPDAPQPDAPHQGGE